MEAGRNATEMLKGRGQVARILGVHLEGQYLNPRKCGALDKGSFIKPTLASFNKLIAGFEDMIKIMTIAPEMPGALKVIARCRELGISKATIENPKRYLALK